MIRLLLWTYHALRADYYHRMVSAGHPDDDVTDAWNYHRERARALN